MSKQHPEALTFVAPTRADGRPARFIAGIPTRDLGPADVAKLSDAQVKAAVDSGLYEAAKPPKPEPSKAEKKGGD